MKNLIKFSIVMAVLCITACTQTFENTSNEVQKKAQGRLVMKVGNESRTIKPAIGESDVKTAVLTANGEEIKSWTSDNIISQIQSTEDILLDVGNYDFTMTFRNAGNIDILTATISQEIVTGDNILKFDMKPVTTGTGDISITLTWDDPSEIYTITAGLYDIANNTPVEDFADSELEITSTEEQTPIATYSKNAVPVGSYIIKFKSYKDNILLNTSTDVIKVAAGITTSTQITLSKINRQYTITYNLSDGKWADGFTATEDRNGNKKIVLPTAEKIIRDGYKFDGWYDDNNNKITEIPSDTMENIYVTAKWLQLYTITYNLNGGENNTNNPASYTVETETITLADPTKNSSTFLGWYNDSGEVITEIPSETAANITVTARWSTTCTVSDAESVILALSGEGPHDIVVTGEITNVNLDIQAIKDGLNGNQGAKVNLDLSQTTEWDELPLWSFEGCINLTSIILPDDVTFIGDTTFQNCSNLTSINIPYGVTSIETKTFNGCSSLTEIIIPDSVTLIGESAFEGCSSLTSVEIPDGVTTISSSAFNGCSSLTSVEIPDGVTTIGSYVFYGCGLTSVTIPDSVTSIGSSAFGYCGSLTSVTIPDDVTTIGSYAFRHCSSLESVTIGNRVTSIGSYAFWYCEKLTSVTIPDNVTSIGIDAFSYCNAVKTLVTGNGLTSLDYLPITSALESITIGDSITEIGDNKFYEFTNLKSVTFADNSQLTKIGENAFCDCSQLTEITIPDGVQTISKGAFGRTGFTSVQLPDSVIEMGTDIFSGCSNLETVKLPNNITSIPQSTFYKCTNLTSIIIPDGVISIGDSAFSHCSQLTSITFPESVTTIGINVFDTCSELTSFIVHESNQNFSTLEDGKILCDKNKETLIAYPSASGSITILNGIKTIAGNAFVDCTELTDITIPNSVTSIGNGAFGRTGFTSVELPDSITQMGIDVFCGCSSLETVTLSNSITSIPKATFFMCYKLSEIEIPSSVTSIGDIAFSACYALTSIDIPDSVTTIERNAFSDCSGLESVTIGNGVTSIGETAFGGCYSLTTVNYRGTEEEWGKIEIDTTNYELTSATKTYDYTGN